MIFYRTVISPSTKDILSAHPKCQQRPRKLNISRYTLSAMLTSTWNEPAALTHRDHDKHSVFFRVKPLRGITATGRGLQIQYIQMTIIRSS